MKAYMKPEIEVINFEVEEIMTASGGIVEGDEGDPRG